MIVAFDPGVTTGVAWINEDGTFGAGQFDEPTLYEWVDALAETFEHAQIELFTIDERTLRTKRVYDSMYIIGYLKYKRYQYGFDVGYTKPTDVMAPFPDKALKRAKMHTPGKIHANDAARHLAHYLVRTGRLSGAIFLER